MSQFDQVEEGKNLFSLSKRPLKVGGIFLIIALLLWGGVFFFFTPKPFDTLSGTLYMTLAPQGDKATDLYQFDVKTRQFTKTFDDNFIKYTGKFSPNGERMAFLSAPLDRSSNFLLPYKEFLQVKIYDEKTGIITKLTDINTTNKRIGGWSPDGKKIAFTSQPQRTYSSDEEREKSFHEPNEWLVDVVDLDGNIQHVDTGTSPLWSPDGAQLLFLKNDGLYIYTFSSGKSEKVYDDKLPDEVLTNVKLGLSQDGKSFALSVPDKNQSLLFEVLSWKPLSLKLEKETVKYGKSMFWPVFSPDGRYMVFQEAYANPDLSKTLTYPFLVAYDRITKKYLVLTGLDQYNFDFAFIDDWR